MRLILPLLLIIIAGGLFFGLTTELFAEIDNLRLSKIRVDEDLTKARELQDRFDTLQTQVNQISQTDLDRLEVLLPRNVDTVDLLTQINSIAKGNGMILADVSVSTSEGRSGRSAGPIAGLNTVTFGFGVSGTYAEIKEFLADLERNLRLVDISDISFGAAEGGIYQYSIELKTYWIK